VTERDENRLTGALALRASFLGLPRSPYLVVNIAERKYSPYLERLDSLGGMGFLNQFFFCGIAPVSNP